MRKDQEFRQELENALDFDTVLTQIASFASFSRSAEKILNAMPEDNLPAIRYALSLAEEGLAFERSGSVLSIGGIQDVTAEVAQAEKGMTLAPADLLAVASFLAACRTVSAAFDPEQYPQLADVAGTIDICSHLFDEIGKCIDLSGSVKEDATSRLRALHQQQLRLKADLGNAGRQFLKKNASSLMENMTTTIGGRLCVLIKASDKNKFGGMIHGSSQSGQAFYVEPNSFVDLNNEIQAAAAEIEEEKKRICRELSQAVKRKASALYADLDSLELIDTALAKGRWAAAKDGTIPILHTHSHDLRLEHAVHPLLDMQTAVPNTYTLQGQQRALMISGPNMGGKTVTLKTIGLFTALAQAGFPVSAHRAVLPFYEQMFFDIGDNQSIQNNLSTFSSHVKHLTSITDAASSRTFVLLDEAGNGTDPLEGASLAQAVLEYLVSQDATVITSTHYDSLKAYGKSDPRILVSSVEFDPVTLKPTYRYLPGVSGASYAFAIASQFSMKPEILERADALKKENESEVQRQLEHLEHLQADVQAQKDRFSSLVADAHALQKETQQEKEKWDRRKAALDADYETRLDAMLEEHRKEAREILADMRKANGPYHEQIARMRRFDEMEPEIRRIKEAAPSSRPLQVGNYVHVEVLNNHGEIVELKKKKAVVSINGKKITVGTDQLTLITKPKPQKAQRTRHKERTFEAFPMELNLIGMRVEEALSALDHYLDQAVVHRIKNVRIIHGVGTGALRSAVWKDLASRKNMIRSYASGGPGEGGLGATVVELK